MLPKGVKRAVKAAGCEAQAAILRAIYWDRLYGKHRMDFEWLRRVHAVLQKVPKPILK
jgi:hypothetical protein